MDQAIREKMPGKPRALVAPLDWGLGHTTRCIPLIRELISQGADVILAGNDRQAAVFTAEFPDLPILPLKGYNVRYASTAAGLYSALLLQVPSLLKSIRREHDWLIKICQQYQIDLVISDNRYGLHHPEIPSIIITHQLQILCGLGKWTDTLLRKRNYSYISKFKECWVPDHRENGGFAGKLSHPSQMPQIPVRYIGPLTRFKHVNKGCLPGHLLVILSGPEPQRTIFETLLLNQLKNYKGHAAVVRGLPEETSAITLNQYIKIHNHLPSALLEDEIISAEFVIARCGYSTVMDLAAIGKKSILIPTPGQGEQEYLGTYLAKSNFALVIKQKEFDLQGVLEKAKTFSFKKHLEQSNGLELQTAIQTLIDRVR